MNKNRENPVRRSFVLARLWLGEASTKIAADLAVGFFLVLDPLLVVRE